MEKIKKKRGRPCTINKMSTGPIEEKSPVVPVLKVSSENKKLSEKKIEKKKEVHPLEIAVPYIEEHLGPREKEWITKHAKNKGWSKKFYIWRAIRDFFELKDENFDGEIFK